MNLTSVKEKARLEKKKVLTAAAAALLWFLICMVCTPVYTTVTITYADDPSGEYITTVYSGVGENVTADDARSRVINSAVARISYYDIDYYGHTGLKRIDPVQSECGETLTIESLTVRRNGILVAALDGSELSAYFTGNDQVSFTEDGGFSFDVTGEDPQLYPTEAFDALYNSHGVAVFLIGYLCSAAAVALIALLIRWVLLQVGSGSRYLKVTNVIFAGGVLLAVLMVIYVALRSPFWANPDEYDVKSAVLYYFEHFMPPDIRSAEIADSFPVYGTSRHFEFSMFYFLAGKVGQFFSDPSVQIRLFSLIIFTVMAVLAVKNIQRNFALLFVILLTPQVWYIFSYSTSDALDFFVSFLILREFTEEDSMLNRLFREPFSRRHILYCGYVSLLFLNILWAKASFYTVLLFAFLILLIRLLHREKRERGPLLRKYLTVVGCVIALFMVRYMITDYGYYGFDKYSVIVEVTNKMADYAYKYTTPAAEAAYSMRFFEKGVTLRELLTEYDFNENLFKTFSGFFGSYEFGEADWYYIVMGVLYIALVVYLVYRLWKQKKSVYRWETAAVLFVCFVQYVIIVLQSWFNDFQPQGRYALPVLCFIAYLVSRVDDAESDRILRGLLVCTAVMSLFCFLDVGIPNLVPDTIV